MALQIVPQIIKIHMLSNISRSKLNQTMKFDQLIEIFFLKNHTRGNKRGGKISPRHYNKEKIEYNSGSNF